MASCGVKVLSSGSSANGYVITAGGEMLILELGCNWKEYLKAIEYNISSVSGVLVTHGHKDHSRSIKDALKYNLNVYSGSNVDGAKLLQPMKKYRIGGFLVTPLRVEHGGCENSAYVIEHEGMLKTLFITDAEDFRYNVKNVGCLMCECNYSNEIKFGEALEGSEIRSNSEAHMELETTLDVVRRHYSESLRKVVLLHLSSHLSDERAFKEAVKGEVGLVDVEAARKGLEIELNKEEF